MGAGAIGCYLGGRLRASGLDVVFVGRASLASSLGAQGMHLTSIDGFDRLLAPSELTVATTPEALASCDVVLVTVKGGATTEAAKQLRAATGDSTLVVSFQNGVRNPELLRAELGTRVLAGMVPFNVRRVGDNGFHHGTTGVLAVEKDPRARPLVEALARAGLPTYAAPDMRAVLWGKLLLNLNNSLNALSGVPLVEQLSQRVWRRMLADSQAEALAALSREGIKPDLGMGLPAWLMPHILRLPNRLFLLIANRMVKIDADARSSMWEDLERRRPTEIDALNGEVVRLAGSLGMPAPVNTAIARLVHEAEGKGSPKLSASELQIRVQSGIALTI
jgi:2-dehydropantoate 2-reductase